MCAVAARQCGKTDDLRGQLTQARLAGCMVLQPATSPGPAALTYAAVACGGFCPASAFLPGPGAAAAPVAMLPNAAQNLGEISVHKTPLGLTGLSDDLASVQKLKTLIEQNPVTSTAISVRLVQQRKPHVKLTGVDPEVPAVSLIAQINSHNPDLQLDPSTCEVRVSFKKRSGNFTHLVAVDPPAYRALMSRGRVSVGWTAATLVEDVHLPTCTFCTTYGHGRRLCPVRQHPERARMAPRGRPKFPSNGGKTWPLQYWTGLLDCELALIMVSWLAAASAVQRGGLLALAAAEGTGPRMLPCGSLGSPDDWQSAGLPHQPLTLELEIRSLLSLPMSDGSLRSHKEDLFGIGYLTKRGVARRLIGVIGVIACADAV
ncbi:hypothetical protein HPB49_008492 [Dermacentor silvarum]|uniref:Uncharacterized protein n=1 Tax=Dermacentor silvarum TaxID=543639 RepID=A0ACB8DC90_DERSI|nr:hypothetical protein HPB49_008492 [Dermacentor silvarum]